MPRSVRLRRLVPAAEPGVRRTWWATFALLLLAGTAWSVATPLMSGADESDHAIRAAAAARGQLVGGETHPLLGSRNVFIDVEVPEAYAGARGTAACFIDTRRSPAPNPSPFDAFGPPPECRAMEGDHRRVTATTLQYRGQPTYYAVVGLPTLLWPDGAGVRAMRLASAALTAALLASAVVAARSLPGRRAGVLAVLAGVTPVALWLAGQVNSGGAEIAAALLAWTAGVALVRAPAVTGRAVARAGVGLAVLPALRGLSPLFAVAVVAVVTLVADRARVGELLGRRDLRRWGAVVAASGLASVAWLAYVQLRFPLDDRPGSGWATALGDADWYLRQTVGVFGVNDIVLPGVATAAWLAVVAGVVGVGLWRASARARLVVAALALGSFAVNVTAEGLSLPPIGYYWQGRYVLPLLVGVAVVAAASPARGTAPAAGPRSAAVPRSAAIAATAVLVAVHGWAFAEVSRHMAGRGQGDIGVLDALGDPAWSPPVLPAWAWTVVYVGAVAGASVAALAGTPAARGGRAGEGGRRPGGAEAAPPTVEPLAVADRHHRP